MVAHAGGAPQRAVAARRGKRVSDILGRKEGEGEAKEAVNA